MTVITNLHGNLQAQLQVAKTICLLEPKVSHPTNNENKLGESRQDVTKARNDFLPMLSIISSNHSFLFDDILYEDDMGSSQLFCLYIVVLEELPK